MQVIIGVDGGGTKTAFCASDLSGRLIGTCILPSCSYHAYGFDLVLSRLHQGISSCLQGLPLDTVAAIALGLPCFGEHEGLGREIHTRLVQAYPNVRLVLVNDVEVAWMAGLSGQPGVHVVAGTGAIAYGRNAAGEARRSGGWSEFYGDEGSCYWLGRLAMGLFAKQIDGRLPKGPLYKNMCQHLGLTHVDQFGQYAQEIAPHREQVAALQVVLGQSALEGDENAWAAYGQAAGELALLAGAISTMLQLPPGFPVTYSGGLFHNGALILDPLKERIHRLGGTLQPPALPPIYGGLPLAYEALGQPDLDTFIRQLAQQHAEGC